MLFREAKFIMAMSFSPVVVGHLQRSCNSLAHDLAHFGRNRDPDDPAVSVSIYPLPDFVNALLIRDLTEPRIN